MNRDTLIHWRNGLLVGLIGGIGLYWLAYYSWPIILLTGTGMALFSRFLSAKYSPFLFDWNKKPEALIARGAEVNARDGIFNDAPLHLAALNGHTTTVEALIARGAEVNARDNNSWTPLHLAVWKGHAETAKALIACGAEIDARDKDNRTPLHRAASSGHTEIVKALIAQGAEIDARDKDNRTLLHWAAFKGHTATAEALIVLGAEVNARDAYIWTPLHCAAFEGHTATVEALIARGTEVDAGDADIRTTPLHLAAWSGHTATVEALITRGANLHAWSSFGRCALGLAACKGRTSTVSRALAGLSETARQRLLAERGEHIIAEAFENGRDEIVTLLQNEYGMRLPAHLHHRANGRLNGAQSTHEVSVHESVSQSVLALASCYLPGLSNQEKKALRAWYDSALNDSQRSRYKENAQKLMEQLLKRSAIQDYIKHCTAELQQFRANLQEQSCGFKEHNALKVTAAKKVLARLLDNANYRNFTDSRSGVPMNLALALVYQGVRDKNNTHLIASEKGRCKIFVQAFYEMQRGYNLNDDGKETNTLAADRTICVPGHFNKLISALGGGRHEAVNIIFVTKEVARLKVQALIKKHYAVVPPAEQTRYFGEIHGTHKLPAYLWNTYLKELVLAELHQEYDSFVKSGMLPQRRLDSAINIAINGALPKYVLEVMLYSARLAEEIDEETQAAIIACYDLYLKEEPYVQPEYIAQGKHRAEELDVELPSTFFWAERRQVLGPKAQAKMILEYFANQVKRTSSFLEALAENEPTSTEAPHCPLRS